MRVRLPVKIFIAFLTVTVASIAMVVIANRYFANRNFESYLRFKGMKTLAVFANTLADAYKKHHGWKFLSTNSKTWNDLIQERWPSDERIPNTAGSDQFLGTEISVATEVAVSVLPSPPAPLPGGIPGRLYPHVSLFNVGKKLIAGEKRAFRHVSTLPVKVDGKTVGWVGLAFGGKLTHPLDQQFMKKLSRVFHLIGTAVLLVSIVIAFLLTKHLLSPIKRLSEAVEALGDRNFGTRIPVICKDELGTLANRFNKMAEKLEIYERNQQQWLSDISHELRTPLSVLIGEIEALKDGIRKPDVTSLSSLCDEAKHLSKIVNDLQYLSLSEAGSAPTEMGIIKPVPVLSQAIFFYKNRLESNGMALEVLLDAAFADLEMKGDRDRLLQLFTNLLENALIHTNKPGSLAISQARSNGHLHILFEDTGPGVPGDALPRIFERLYRADPSRSRKTGSSGLGLAICKTIVENHRGRILADNSERGGLKIEIVLPVSAG